MSAETTWDALNRALQTYTPPCEGHAAFTADFRTELQGVRCASVFARCPIADLCGAYARTAKVDSGYWAGVDHNPRRRRPVDG